MNRKPDSQSHGGSSRAGMDADRLCDAADAAWAASSEIGRNLHMTPPRPDRLKGSLIEPMSLRGFTAEEIREATAFLIRLGCEFGPLMPGRPV